MSEFTIKQIFIDNWDNFTLNCYDTLVRPVVFDEVNKIINCGNLDFIILVVLNMLKIELWLWLKNLFVVNTDISFLLYLINYGCTFKNIDTF